VTTGLRFHKWGSKGGRTAWQAWVRLLHGGQVVFVTTTLCTKTGAQRTQAWQDARCLTSVGTYAHYNDSSATVTPTDAKEPY
jgi:hypothetical protein